MPSERLCFNIFLMPIAKPGPLGLNTFHERLSAFQNENIKSDTEGELL